MNHRLSFKEAKTRRLALITVTNLRNCAFESNHCPNVESFTFVKNQIRVSVKLLTLSTECEIFVDNISADKIDAINTFIDAISRRRIQISKSEFENFGRKIG